MFGRRATAGDFERLATLSTESIVVTIERSIEPSRNPSGTVIRIRAHRIAQNTCLTPRILLDLRKLHRRVDRYRHRTT